MVPKCDGRLEDAALTESGAFIRSRSGNDGRGLVIACGALAREILAVFEASRFEHLDLRCLPAQLHNRPQKIPNAVREAILKARSDGYAEISIAYADCGTGGALDAVCAELGVERISGPHCYAFFDGQNAFAARAEDEIGAFYLTDFLARQFEAMVWRGLGLDRFPDLRDDYFRHYDRLVYLAQTDDAALDAAAQSAAQMLGLAYERRFTGYGELAEFVREAAFQR